MDAIYKLEKYNGLKTRYTCPECGGKHKFTRYIDSEGNYIADHVGRCDRESKCMYHLTPKQYFDNNPALMQPRRQTKSAPVKPIQYVSPDVLQSTLKAYSENTFVKYLHKLFDPETVQRLIDRYGLGTTKNGSCIFWQVDNVGLIRTGKVIKYKDDGHRDKSIHPYFIHTKLNIIDIDQCLYGYHLLSSTPIGLVEAEKTAVIMAGKLPDYTWMATGGKLNLSKVDVLKGKKVLAFPDSDAFSEWTERLSPYGFKVSNALQKHLSIEQQSEGLDLADLVTKAKNYFETLKDGRVIEMNVAGYPSAW